jgi:hypothetical protein
LEFLCCFFAAGWPVGPGALEVWSLCQFLNASVNKVMRCKMQQLKMTQSPEQGIAVGFQALGKIWETRHCIVRFAFDEVQQILMAFWALTLNHESVKGRICRHDYT